MDFLSNVSTVPSWLWLFFTIGIVILLLVDLSLFKVTSQSNKTKHALLESCAWIGVALMFNGWFAWNYGSQLGIEFFTGYLVEKTLSMDNIFVILLIFSSFKVPMKYQHRVLFYGVLGAIVMRGLFILFGAHLLHHFHWIMYLFGGILVYTGIKFLFDSDDESNSNDSFIIRKLKKLIPTTDKIEGKSFFVKQNGIRKATPLFLALIVIEITDLIFAIDSVPAVFAVTSDAFVAFASNILAILGLRALYFVLADWIVKLRYLKPGLAVILGFIGLKMLLTDWIKIPSWMSLLVIIATLLTAALSSWYVAKIEGKKK
ncbi:TerC family protein [Pigmentibacter sp. JX0631]|uniref:TerC family protein n=1 Tax=Pigmentibacter sp. JX0631 TaxID=2976982 RepID=UPI002468ECE8|nr:TerC family protein [Pigmentibacter sp. JX0631]WGL60585.1 TerC family protein [Pigmentibacter sp. JX0631]